MDTRPKDAPDAALDSADLGGWKIILDKEGEASFKSFDLNKIAANTSTITVPIGDWDMTADSFIMLDLNSYIDDFSKVSSISCFIHSDPGFTIGGIQISNLEVFSNSINDPAGSVSLNYGGSDSGSVFLFRDNLSFFNSTGFDSTSYNRGYVVITLIGY